MLKLTHYRPWNAFRGHLGRENESGSWGVALSPGKRGIGLGKARSYRLLRSRSYRMRIHSRSTLGSAFSALWRASALSAAVPCQTIHSWAPGRSWAAGPETASISPLTSAMTFQSAMWLSMFLTMYFNRVGKAQSTTWEQEKPAKPLGLGQWQRVEAELTFALNSIRTGFYVWTASELLHRCRSFLPGITSCSRYFRTIDALLQPVLCWAHNS